MSIKNIFIEAVKAEKTVGDLNQVIQSTIDGVFTGDLWMENTGRTSLKGSPKIIKDGDFVISRNRSLKSLEFGPEEVDGDFLAKECLLTSLDFAPKIVKRHFNVNFNKIGSLVGCPEYVGMGFEAERCGLTSLEGITPRIGEEGDRKNTTIVLVGNKISNLKNIHKHLKYCKGTILFQGNPIKSNILGLLKIQSLQGVIFDDGILTKIMEKYLPEGDLLACQQELIDAGYEEFAQL